MTKEELKQKAEVCMHNALYWLKLPISKENVEQGGSYILKLLEPREKRIAELEKENAELKERNAELKGMYAHSAREAGTYKQFLELKEKENAELKEELKDANKKVVHLACNQNKDLKRKINKAKEIIKTLADDLSMYSGNYQKELLEAKQFIKDSEVKE